MSIILFDSLDCYFYICSQNMVGPGEVDDDLEPETAEECGKYGKVAKVVISRCFSLSILQRHNVWGMQNSLCHHAAGTWYVLCFSH